MSEAGAGGAGAAATELHRLPNVEPDRNSSPSPPARSYVGGAPGKIDLYVGKEVVRRNIDNDKACDELIDLIKVGAHGSEQALCCQHMSSRCRGWACAARRFAQPPLTHTPNPRRSMAAGRTPPRRRRARRPWLVRAPPRRKHPTACCMQRSHCCRWRSTALPTLFRCTFVSSICFAPLRLRLFCGSE